MAAVPAFLRGRHDRTFFLFGESLLFPNIFMYGTLDRAKTFSSCLRAFLSKQIRIVRFLSLFPGIYVIMLCNISVLLLTAFGRLPTAANAVCDGSRLCDEPRSFSRPLRSVPRMRWGFRLHALYSGQLARAFLLGPSSGRFTRISPEAAQTCPTYARSRSPQNTRILFPVAGAASGIVRWIKLHIGGTQHETTQTSR